MNTNELKMIWNTFYVSSWERFSGLTLVRGLKCGSMQTRAILATFSLVLVQVLKLLQCRMSCILSSCVVRSFAHFREIADSWAFGTFRVDKGEPSLCARLRDPLVFGARESLEYNFQGQHPLQEFSYVSVSTSKISKKKEENQKVS